ncbi:PREDICTED: uncharacterized protein LOC105566399 isoform X2 [Vollenhovia emeryi]|uniref:uncharacterized protein LOC105566399 isoform X2 n=1 Tax=Vollenhovia emeryi TaxID=411798 RepID=UPI0005F56B22|nr:PREDICTED: uncharacterized protein LOC105566399 isoform X2 [Vollenhovia emeryi]
MCILVRLCAQEQQLKCDTSVKSLSSKSYDDASSVSCGPYFGTCTQKKTKSQRRRCSTSRRAPVKNGKLYFESSTSVDSVKISTEDDSCLSEKILTITDYTSKMQEISNDSTPEEIPQKKSDAEYSSIKENNAHTAAATKRTVCILKLEQCNKTQSLKGILSSNIINTDVENEIPEKSQDIKTNLKSKDANLSDKLLTTYNNGSRKRKCTRTISSTSFSTDSTEQAADVSEPFGLKPIHETCEIDTNPREKRMRTRSSDSSLATDSTVLIHQTCNNMSKNQAQNCLRILSDTDSTVQATDSTESLIVKPTPQTVSKTCPNIVPVTVALTKLQCESKTSETTKKKLPKITEDHVLPKGTVKFVKVRANNRSSQNRLSKQGQNRCNGINSNVKQVSCVENTFKSANTSKNSLLTEKVSPTPEINGSFSINLKNQSINNKLHHKYDSSMSSSVETMETRNSIHNNVNACETDSDTTYEDCTLNHQKQSNKLDGRESKILQSDKTCNKINSDKSILNESSSGFMDISENWDINRSLILVNKEAVTKQNGEHIEISTTSSTKKKLNRTNWMQKIVTSDTKSFNRQQFNGSSNIDTMVTVKSNLAEENNSNGQLIDLRKCLNQKRAQQFSKLSTSEDKLNNKAVESEQVHLDDEITLTNTVTTDKFHKEFSFKEPASSKTLYREKDIQTDECNNGSILQSTPKETRHINQIDRDIHEDTNAQKKFETSEDKDDYGDCISLFAESFDTNFDESTILSVQNKPNKSLSLHFDEPYEMTVNSFDKYVKQNETEFNKEYAKFEENIKLSNRTGETKKELYSQSRQAIRTNNVPETETVSKVPPEAKNTGILQNQRLRNTSNFNIRSHLYGYCFQTLMKGYCVRQQCRYNHEFQDLITTVGSGNFTAILGLIKGALDFNYIFFCTKLYKALLRKLTTEQILTIYQVIYYSKAELPNFLKDIGQYTIEELLNRQIPVKTVVNRWIECIPSPNSNDLMNMLKSIEKHIKCGEYWNTVRTLVLKLPLEYGCYMDVMKKILTECIENENLTDIQDVNDNLISKLPHYFKSKLGKDLERFKSLLAEKTARKNNPRPALLIQDCREKLSETIASPDGNSNLSQIESPQSSSSFIDKSTNGNKETKENGEAYILRPIDNLPEPRSAYRNHINHWKFFVDLEGFKKGLLHHDYDYVINMLKSYAEKQDDTPLYTRSCCKKLQTEIKRSEYHLANVIRRTVQVGIVDILGKMSCEITDILINLGVKEAWGRALLLIQLLDVYNLSYNATYYLLSAEIYLANEKAIKAYDVLKCQNIICTSRDKWYVQSTIDDERVRSKIMCILLDSFCNELVEHAFFLFQFLLKDQSSQYYPIDLSRYVGKLIVLFLLKKDTDLIIEMANLVLKYTFALSTTVCRALTSTLVHLDENLARQIYNYAEGIGVYPQMKLWPVTYIIIKNDLTEEEIYLTFLQLLKNLLVNFGHAIEFAKQIKVYLILEIESTSKRFHCAELKNYNNNKAIMSLRALIRDVLKKRFDPPILLQSGGKDRIYRLQSKSLINYLKAEHC